MRSFLALALVASAFPAQAAPRDWVAAHREGIVTQYLDLLAIPNVASDLPNIRRNAEYIVGMMNARGLNARLLESDDGKVPPLIYGEWLVPGARKTYIIYAHYDGQPADPALWTVTQPFAPVLMTDHHAKGGAKFDLDGRKLEPRNRIYARSASDDKAGVMAILAAVEALKAEGKKPAFNLKIVFEGEEEAGSPNLAPLARRHKAQLASDGWIIVDGPAHPSGAPQLTLGVRGDIGIDVTTYGPIRPLHSGHYGNWAPNPAMLLAQLLASMKDKEGRVTIAGFYDDVTPLTDQEKAAVAAVPSAEAMLRQELALGAVEGSGARLVELLHLPSLNINGMKSADVGDKARNVIPSSATATLDLRLVKGDDPRRQFDKVVRHIQSQGYEVFDREPTADERRRFPKVATVHYRGGYPAERTSLDHPLVKDLAATLKADGPLVILPSTGGSLPLYILREELGAPNVVLSLWNHDNNQHAEDENIKLESLWNGISTIAAIMTMK